MSHDLIVLLTVLIGSGGVVGAIVAFYKLKPETSQIIVSTAQGAVIVQSSVIDSLTEDLSRVRAELQEVRIELAATKAQRLGDIEELRRQLQQAIDENVGLRQRIRDLENGRVGHAI